MRMKKTVAVDFLTQRIIMNQQTIIAFDKVQKVYEDKYALKDFSFEIRKGAFLTVVGGSGGSRRRC